MRKTAQLQNLFDHWKTRHRKTGASQFIIDGIINEDRWNNSPVKICFLLKESYFDLDIYKKDILMTDCNNTCHHWNKYITEQAGFYVYDLANHLRNHKPWFMWRRVENWLNKLYSLLSIDVPAPVQEIAVLNIKKSNGKSISNYRDILSYAHEDRDLIRQELEIIDPDIVICGATYNFCIKENIFDDLQEIATLNEFNGRIVAKSGRRIILDCYHPAAPSISYDTMNDYFKSVLPYLIAKK